MKAQLSNIQDVFSGISSIQTLFYEKFGINQLINLKWIGLVSSFEFSWKNIGHYILPLLKQGFKEATGSEVDIALLLLLFTGYVASAKNIIVHNAIIRKMKLPVKTDPQLSQAA